MLRCALAVFLSWGCCICAATDSPKEKTPPPAKLKISGYGPVGDFRLKRTIRLLESQKQKPAFFDANFIEDSALILMSKLRDDGHLQPEIAAEITLADGQRLTRVWNEAVEEPLPRPLRAREVHFKIKEGVLFHYKTIDFSGLDAISRRHALAYFIETSGLIPLQQNRAYTPGRLQRSLSNLKETLNQMGYQDAQVTVAHLERNDENGVVAVRISVKQGEKFIVRSVVQKVIVGATNAPIQTVTNHLTHPFSRLWEQDFIQSVQTNYYSLGYPETSVTLETARQTPSNNVVFVDMIARVTTGPRVRTGEVEFSGYNRTKASFLQEHVSLTRGDWLDRMKAEDGRYRLARLGIFDSVNLSYQRVDTNLWNVHYTLQEGKRIDVSPIIGFGSYDLLRGGIEVNQYNLWGRAHNSRLQLIQSFKSSSGDYTYTIPELLGENLDFFLNASALRRQEVSFIRVEYGGGMGVRRHFRRIDTDATLRYNYGVLQATESSVNFAPVGAKNPTAGELIADIRQDRRDNPLNPQKGYQVLANAEVATEYLGGNANFQRIELAASYHIPLNESEWIHLGLRHGVVATIGATSQDLPFTRRFFPGGENSVRGYPEGEAAPRDAQGKIVGAETYLSGNVEFEQALTPRWSLVAFVDGVGFAQQLKDYPENQALFSAGGGVRWKTLVGPVRLEYGYNLNPRPKDPSGTLQFSLGFPF